MTSCMGVLTLTPNNAHLHSVLNTTGTQSPIEVKEGELDLGPKKASYLVIPKSGCGLK